MSTTQQRSSEIKTKERRLTFKQKLFCKYYLETSGNGTEAIVRAGYGNGRVNRVLAKSMASENLTKPNILKYINSLLEKNGLNDEMVSSHHLFLIQQFADLSAKNRAIDMYYKMKGKYSANLVKLEHGVNEELEKFLDRQNKMLP